jgi:hypothetical protein
MPNKPNCPKRGTEAVSRSRPADRIPSIPLFYHFTIAVRYRGCQTNPISESRSVGAGDRSCETNPIGGSPMAGLGSWLNKQTQFAAAPGGTRRRGQCAKQSQFRLRRVGRGLRNRLRRSIVPNEANFALCPMGRGPATRAVEGNRAKQTQSGPAWRACETNPIGLGRVPIGGGMCQTNPIRPRGLCRGCQTKPIQRGPDGCASPMQERNYDDPDAPLAAGKQSQFPGWDCPRQADACFWQGWV